jgi:hypothetical protein
VRLCRRFYLVIHLFQRLVQRTHHRARESKNTACARERDQFDRALLPRLETHRGASGDIEPETARGGAIKAQRLVGLEKMVVRPDLDRPIAGVGDLHPDRAAPGIELDLACLRKKFSRNHGMG